MNNRDPIVWGGILPSPRSTDDCYDYNNDYGKVKNGQFHFAEAQLPKLDKLTPLEVQAGGDHYKRMAIQPVEYITKNNLSFMEGLVIKYVSRHKVKNGPEDIKKAIHTLQLILQLEYGQT